MVSKFAWLAALLISVQSSAQEKTPAPAEKTIADKSAVAEEPRLSPVGRRDPFRPFTLNTRSSPRRRENLSPLERFELGQLKLVGVIWNVKEQSAMVEDSTGLGYTVRIGTAIGPNDGKVKLIKPSEIIIEEAFVDVYGAKKKREVPMKLLVETAE